MEILRKLPLTVILAFSFLAGMWVLGLIFATTPFVILTGIIGVAASVYRIAFFFTFNK